MLISDNLENFYTQIDLIFKNLEKLLPRFASLSSVELAKIDAQTNFLYNVLNELGLNTEIENFLNTYDSLIRDAYNEAKKIGVADIFRTTVEDMGQIKAKSLEYLLGSFKNKADQLELALRNGSALGLKPALIVDNMKSIGLTDYQSNAVLNTFYADFGRATKAKVYELDTLARFKYVGGIIEHSSKQCAWLMRNQKPEGYTWQEIKSGIKTPYFNKHGQEFIINQNGRVPNFNCIHQWVKIYK